MQAGERRLQISGGIDGGVGNSLWPRVAAKGPGVAEALRKSILTPSFTTRRGDVDRAGPGRVPRRGAVALRMLEKLKVDAIVSDRRMPDLDGAAPETPFAPADLVTRVLGLTGA